MGVRRKSGGLTSFFFCGMFLSAYIHSALEAHCRANFSA